MAEQELTNFTNTDCKTCEFDFAIPYNIKECVYESLLIGPENAKNVTFQVGLKSNSGQDADGGQGCVIETSKVEVYNLKTQTWNKLWEFSKSFGAVRSLSFAPLKDKPYGIIPTGQLDEYGNPIMRKACRIEHTDQLCIYPGECASYVRGEGRPRYVCVREEFFLNEDYINKGVVKFRTSLKSTCHNILWYDGIEVGYSEWGIPSIQETISWEASVPNHGIAAHTFYLFSFYGKDTNGTIEGFDWDRGTYKAITTPSISRQDELLVADVPRFDCLTVIAEGYNASGMTPQEIIIPPIYDWKIDHNV